MGELNYLWVGRLARACRLELTRIGGLELADDAEVEARWYAQLYHPWDGDGPEPAERVTAWLGILLARVDLARRRRPQAGPGSVSAPHFLASGSPRRAR